MKKIWFIILMIILVAITVLIWVLQSKDDNGNSYAADAENEIICTDSMKISLLVDKVLNLPEMRTYVDNLNNSRFGLIIENNSNSGIDIEDAIQNFKNHNPPTDKLIADKLINNEISKASIGFGKIDLRNDSALIWAGFGVTYSGMFPHDKTYGGVIATFVLRDCEWNLIELETSSY
jgi:hypothetical protein